MKLLIGKHYVKWEIHFDMLHNTLTKILCPLYYIVILRWPVGSRRLHQITTVIRRATMVRTERGCDLRFVRAISPKLGQ